MIDRDVELHGTSNGSSGPFAQQNRSAVREELLGHLFRIYEEELAEQQGKDDAAASPRPPCALATQRHYERNCKLRCGGSSK